MFGNQWYERISTTIQLILKGGLFIFISLIAFILIIFVWRWVERIFSTYKIKGPAPSLVDLFKTTAAGIKERLPDLTEQNEVEKSGLSAWYPILGLSIIPIIIALVNQEWMFTRAGEVDPWNYISLGYYYFKDPSLLNSYKISRLPWVLIEYLFRNVFTPTAAPILLTVSFAVLGSIGFYLLVSRFFGKTTGFISAALLGSYSYYLINRAPDYHNTAGSLFLIWSLYLLTRAIQAEKNQSWLFLAFGAVIGLAVHSEFFVLGCVPAIAVQFLMSYWCLKKRFILKAVLFSLLGFLFITGLLGLAALLSGRTFFFFINQLRQVTNYSELYGANFYSGLNKSWPLGAKHLAWPVAIFLSAAGWLVINARKILLSHSPISRRSWFQLSINLQMILLGIIWLAGEISQREFLLRYYMVHPVYIYTFLALAGFLAMEKPLKINFVILGSVVVIVCGSLAFSDKIFSVISLRFLPRWPILQPLLFYGLILTFLTLVKRRELAILSIVLLMSLGNVMGMPAITTPGSLSSAQLSLDNNQCHIRKDGYLSVIDTFQHLWGLDWDRTHLWWDANETIPLNNCPEAQIGLGKIGLSVTRTGIQSMYRSEPSLPIVKIPMTYYQQLAQQKGVVAVITNNPSNVSQMLAKLRTFGNWSLFRQDTILQGDIRFSLYVFTLDGKIR